METSDAIYDEHLSNEIREDAFEFLQFSLKFGGFTYNESQLHDRIINIHTYHDIKCIPQDDFLFFWRPSLVYSIFGREKYFSCDLNKPSSITHILVQPLFLDKKELIMDRIISTESYLYEVMKLRFTRKLVTYLYGGMPYIKPYLRLIQELDVINRETISIRVEKRDGSNILDELGERKRNFREEFPELFVSRDYGDRFKAEVNPFHIPDGIDNEVHSRAIHHEVKHFLKEIKNDPHHSLNTQSFLT